MSGDKVSLKLYSLKQGSGEQNKKLGILSFPELNRKGKTLFFLEQRHQLHESQQTSGWHTATVKTQEALASHRLLIMRENNVSSLNTLFICRNHRDFAAVQVIQKVIHKPPLRPLYRLQEKGLPGRTVLLAAGFWRAKQDSLYSFLPGAEQKERNTVRQILFLGEEAPTRRS